MGQGFVKALTLINLLAMAGGVTLGIIIGCLPGLSAAMGVALMLPLTFTMPADTGLIVLGAIYCGAIFGGSISAILIHTPGTPFSSRRCRLVNTGIFCAGIELFEQHPGRIISNPTAKLSSAGSVRLFKQTQAQLQNGRKESRPGVHITSPSRP